MICLLNEAEVRDPMPRAVPREVASNVPPEVPGNVARSNRREVRNPLLGLAATKRILNLSPAVKAELRALLLELRDDARKRADTCWRTHKSPMAVYWKVVGVYCNHLARVLNKEA